MIDLRDGLFLTRLGVQSIRGGGRADRADRVFMVVSVVMDAVIVIMVAAAAVAMAHAVATAPGPTLLWVAGGLVAIAGVVMLGWYFVERALATGRRR